MKEIPLNQTKDWVINHFGQLGDDDLAKKTPHLDVGFQKEKGRFRVVWEHGDSSVGGNAS